MPTKHKHPWNDQYTDQYGLKVTSRNENSKKVDGDVCCFCQSFGRVVLLTEANLRRWKNTKAHQNLTKFNMYNMKKHMQYRHSFKQKD